RLICHIRNTSNTRIIAASSDGAGRAPSRGPPGDAPFRWAVRVVTGRIVGGTGASCVQGRIGHVRSRAAGPFSAGRQAPGNAPVRWTVRGVTGRIVGGRIVARGRSVRTSGAPSASESSGPSVDDAVEAVSGVAQAGHDVGVLVEPLVDGCGDDLDLA